MKVLPPQFPADPDGTSAFIIKTQIAAWTARVRGVHTQRYLTALALWNSLYAEAPDEELITDEELDDVKVGDEFGTDATHTLRNVLEGIAHEGIWGFTDDTQTIHYWFNPDACTAKARVEFWGHELSHAVLEPLLQAYPDGLDDELLANVIGEIAVQAGIMPLD